MKKSSTFSRLLFALATTFTACTDENVKPQTNEGGGIGAGIDPKISLIIK